MVFNNNLDNLSNLEKVTNSLSKVSIGGLTLLYSYNTIVGFIFKGELTLVENIYSKTTSRDLNKIDKGNRVDLITFKNRLRYLLLELNLISLEEFFLEEYKDLIVLEGTTKIRKYLKEVLSLGISHKDLEKELRDFRDSLKVSREEVLNQVKDTNKLLDFYIYSLRSKLIEGIEG